MDWRTSTTTFADYVTLSQTSGSHCTPLFFFNRADKYQNRERISYETGIIIITDA